MTGYARLGLRYSSLLVAIIILPLMLASGVQAAATWHVPLDDGDHEGLHLSSHQLRLRPNANAWSGAGFPTSGWYRSRPWPLAQSPAAVIVRTQAQAPEGTAVELHLRIQVAGQWQPWQAAAPGQRLPLSRRAHALQLRVLLLSRTAASPIIKGIEVALDGTLSLEKREVGPATFRVFATREGLVGRVTANGHVIRPRDRFVALPSWRVLNQRGERDYQVKVSYGGRHVIVPVWDIGPWNTRDDYWSGQREMWRDLPRGLPEAQAAYQQGYNGGRDEFGRRPALPAGIDLADGTFWDQLGLPGNAWVEVTFLWLVPGPTNTVLDDFEPGADSSWGVSQSANSVVRLSMVSPGAVGSSALQVDYRVDAGGWGVVSRLYATPQDWSSSTALAFRLYGTNSGATLRVELFDDRAGGSTSDTSERFEYLLTDNFTGWQAFNLPWSSFRRRADWQPVGAPNNGLTRAEVYGLSFAPISGAGAFRLYHLELVEPVTTGLEDFESGTATSWPVFKDAGSHVAPSIVSPGRSGSHALQVQYLIGQGGWGGVGRAFATPEDWSTATQIAFWFFGTASGNTIRLEVLDNPAAGSMLDTSERFTHHFVDDWSGWRRLAVPWSSFTRRADWQPAGAPDDGFGRGAVSGYNFAAIGGTGIFQLDAVELEK